MTSPLFPTAMQEENLRVFVFRSRGTVWSMGFSRLFSFYCRTPARSD